jgi:hypothetical protein
MARSNNNATEVVIKLGYMLETLSIPHYSFRLTWAVQ